MNRSLLRPEPDVESLPLASRVAPNTLFLWSEGVSENLVTEQLLRFRATHACATQRATWRNTSSAEIHAAAQSGDGNLRDAANAAHVAHIGATNMPFDFSAPAPTILIGQPWPFLLRPKWRVVVSQNGDVRNLSRFGQRIAQTSYTWNLAFWEGSNVLMELLEAWHQSV